MLIHEITLKNILSFGPDSAAIPLKPLNVIIGPNGSGKSNLIDAIALLQAAPREFAKPIRQGGGGQDWLWKGSSIHPPDAELDCVLETGPVLSKIGSGALDWNVKLHFVLAFSLSLNDRILVVNENLEDFQRDYMAGSLVGLLLMNKDLEGAQAIRDEAHRNLYCQYDKNDVILSAWVPDQKTRERRIVDINQIDREKSILAQIRDPIAYPEVFSISRSFDEIRIYRDWTLGRNAPPRLSQPADMPNKWLEEDASNLGLVLNRLTRELATKKRMLEYFRAVYEDARDFNVSIEGGRVQVFVQEEKFTVPATRLSDGTLRYLCLLAILLDPTPPPLICIDEPELGLHPDLINNIVSAMKDASKRTQLIVTTHSPAMVDAFHDDPEAILVCEKHNGCTTMERLDSEHLKPWLEKYRLGELWSSGEIGGNRW